MFLATLNEEQKLAYLDLSYSLITADGSMSEDEMVMMGQYRQEMNIVNKLADLSGDVDRAITVFQNTPDTIKKRILFELVGLAYADKDYAEAEHAFLERCCAAWRLDLSCIKQCKKFVAELMNLYGEIGHFINAP